MLFANQANDKFELYGVKVYVADIDEAIDFYSGTIGYKISDQRFYPEMVVLSEQTTFLMLQQTNNKSFMSYPGNSNQHIIFLTVDITSSTNRLKEFGVNLINENLISIGGRKVAGFKDPFGNINYLIEDFDSGNSFIDHPKLFKLAINSDNNEKANEFYSNVFGFSKTASGELSGETYLSDGNNLLELLPVEIPPNNGFGEVSRVVLVLGTLNLDASIRSLRKQNVKIVFNNIQKQFGINFTAVKDLNGNTIEIFELKSLGLDTD